MSRKSKTGQCQAPPVLFPLQKWHSSEGQVDQYRPGVSPAVLWGRGEDGKEAGQCKAAWQ